MPLRSSLCLLQLCALLVLGGCIKPLTGAATGDAGADIDPRFQPHKDVEATLDDQWVITPLDTEAAQDVGAAVDAADDATGTADAVTATDAVAAFCGDGACNNGEWCGSCAGDCGACPKVCAPLSSLGCAPGLQCFPNPPDNLCAPPGTTAAGSACQSWNQCEFNSLCVAGVCRSLCDASGTDSAAACKPGVPCEKLVFDGGDAVAADLGACKPGDACNPLSDQGCAAGQTCVPYGWLKTCTKAGGGGAGQACADNNPCIQGLLCVQGACRLRCTTAGGEPSCAASACLALLGPDGSPVPENVGWCK